MRMNKSGSKRPILLLAKYGLVIRNLLLGTFADMVLRERPLIVAVTDPSNTKLKEVIGGRPITLVPFYELPPNGTLSRVEQLTNWHTYMYRFKQAEKGTSSLELQTRQWESGHTWLGRSFIGGMVGVGHALVNLQLMGAAEEMYLRSIGRWTLTEQWYRLLETSLPGAMVSTMLTHAHIYHPSIDLPPVLAARRLKIPAGTLVQSWDNLTSKTAVLPSWLDRYWTWSDFMSRELREMNPRVPEESIACVGSPQFDFHRRPEIVKSRAEYLPTLGLDPERPYVLIGTGTQRWSPDEPEKTVRIIDLLRQRLPELQTLVRLHPKDHPSRWKRVWDKLQELGSVIQVTAPETHMDQGGFVPPADFYQEQVNSISHAAVVINMASTLTVDSAILDRPVISIAYDVEPSPKYPEGRAWLFNNSTHFKTLVDTGGVRVVRSEEHLIDAVADYLKHPEIDRNGREAIAEIVAGPLDGRAGERLAEQVLSIAVN